MRTYIVSSMTRKPRAIRAANSTEAARKFIGHTYICWLTTMAFGAQLFESDTDGERIVVELSRGEL